MPDIISSIAATISSATGTSQASSGAVARGKPMSVTARSAPRWSINLAAAATAKTAASNNLTPSKIAFIITPTTSLRSAAPCDFIMPRECAKAATRRKGRGGAALLSGRRFITIAA